MERAFCGALRDELTEYFRLISVLEGQAAAPGGAGLSLRRLLVWTREPILRMRTLATLVDGCGGKKGGALARAVHSYAKHGDRYIKELVERAMGLVNRPLYEILHRWLFEGELDDAHAEFFVAEDAAVAPALFWSAKYALRESMLPLFVPKDLGDRVLLIGKTINFLRRVCDDQDPLFQPAAVVSLRPDTGADAHEAEAVLRAKVERIHLTVSSRLLAVMKGRYQLLAHLSAVRRYMLLGQGDFVEHLMDLLEMDLAKPASTLYLHNLTATLETAVRSTNAQYDEPEILRRLDVKLLEVSPGDVGWDVFSLSYRTDGPIAAVFTAEATQQYLKIFHFLWRTKRVEHLLGRVWSTQTALNRTLATVPEMAQLVRQSHAMHAAMGHFVTQIQHYVMFEVLECSWADLHAAIDAAGDLDAVIAAHSQFLAAIVERALLGSQSERMRSQLRSIFDVIVKFKAAVQDVYGAGSDAVERRMQERSRAHAADLAEGWGTTATATDTAETRDHRFVTSELPRLKARLDVIAQQFRDMVGHFLTMLTLHADPNLRFLSFRIDFNEYYRRLVPEYQEALSPMTSKARMRPRREESRGGSSLGNPEFSVTARG